MGGRLAGLMGLMLALGTALLPGTAVAEEEFPIFPPLSGPLAPPALVVSCDGDGRLAFRPNVSALAFGCRVTNTTPEPMAFAWKLEGGPGSDALSVGPSAGGPFLIGEFETVPLSPDGLLSVVRGSGASGARELVLRVNAFDAAMAFPLEGADPFAAPPGAELDPGVTGLPAPDFFSTEVAAARVSESQLQLFFDLLLDTNPVAMATAMPNLFPVPTQVPPTPVPTAVPAAAAPTAGAPAIMLSYRHAGNVSYIVVKGRGFAPLQQVVIRTTTTPGTGVLQNEVRTHALADGTLDAEVAINRYGDYTVVAGDVTAKVTVKGD